MQPPPAGELASHCVFAIVLEEGVDRAASRGRLAKRGVQTSVHFPALHCSAAYGERQEGLPITEAFAERAVSLPIFPHMEEWQREMVIEATLEAAATAREQRAGVGTRSRSAVAG